MKIKYVPVLRYRREERKALMSIKLSNKILPLLELVSERAAQRKTGSFQDTYLEDFSKLLYPVLVDIPIYMNVNSGTRDTVKLFLNKFKQNPGLKIDYYRQLSINKNMIPVISYDTKGVYSPGTLIKDYLELRKDFNRVAFRVFSTKNLSVLLLDIEKVANADDILIFDIKNNSHKDTQINVQISLIHKIKSSICFTTVIIKSVITPDIIFKRMNDGDIVSEADNSLLSDYINLGFDAFGDYAGIRKDLTISKGGSTIPSPGFIFYSWHINSYLGYKGRIPDYKEFIDHIKPNVTTSVFWLKYTDKHRDNCPGCKAILSSNSVYSWDWKRYSIQHYLYTMEENL
jgi:hypothetical protein